MKLILDTLERARLAASPSDAILLADALADLEALDAALDARGWTLAEVANTLDDFAAVVNHVAAQPFDVSDTGQDEFDAVTIQETTPGAFVDWLADLERLAQ